MSRNKRFRIALVAKLRTAWRMPTDARAAALHALCVTPLVEIALRCLPLPRVCSCLGITLVERSAPAATRREQTPPQIALTIRRAQRAAELALRNWGYQRNYCLRRALVTGELLRRHKPSLRIGVRRQNDRCEAHAWLTLGETCIDVSNSAVEFQELRRPHTPRVDLQTGRSAAPLPS